MNKNYTIFFTPLIVGAYIILRNPINNYLTNIKKKYYSVFPKVIEYGNYDSEEYDEKAEEKCSLCKKEYKVGLCYPCWMEPNIKIKIN
jgi:hypothetical protein